MSGGTPILTAVAWLVVAPLAVLLAIFQIEVLAGLLFRGIRPQRGTMPRTTVLMPAHDEAQGIAATLAALFASLPDGADVLVVADNCSDTTATLARAGGARVVERHDATRRGKGYALAFGREQLASSPPDVVIVLDADCRIAPGGVAALATAASRLDAPVQADNLQVAGSAASPVVQISNFALLLKNRFRQRGMHGLGGSALLTGTGMAFSWHLFAQAPLASDALAEDLHLGVDLTMTGHRVRYAGGVHVTSAAASQRDTLVQRTRWEHGFVSTATHQALPLLARGLATLSRSRILLALHLLVPPMALLFALGSAALLLVALMGWAGAGWAPAVTLAAALSGAVVATLLCWLAGGRTVLGAGTLLRIPLYLLWKVPIYLKLARGAETQWVRTGRGDGGEH